MRPAFCHRRMTSLPTNQRFPFTELPFFVVTQSQKWTENLENQQKLPVFVWKLRLQNHANNMPWEVWYGSWKSAYRISKYHTFSPISDVSSAPWFDPLHLASESGPQTCPERPARFSHCIGIGLRVARCTVEWRPCLRARSDQRQRAPFVTALWCCLKLASWHRLCLWLCSLHARSNHSWASEFWHVITYELILLILHCLALLE